MAWVTSEQAERSKQVDVLEYIQSTEPGNIQRVGREYRLKDHPSLALSPGKWYWHSRGIGGRTAVGYLTDVRGYGFAEAVCAVLNERPAERFITPNARPPPAVRESRKPFMLPLRNGDNRRVIAYLQSRGVDKEVILDCIGRGSLYETKRLHNCCFVGRDERGKARYAALRGTMGSFKSDVEGSDKRYGFVIPPSKSNSNNVAVFEAPIDVMSHQTLCVQGFIPPFDGWRLSLGGTGLLALERFLKQHPEVSRCLVCTDNDEAGRRAAAGIWEKFRQSIQLARSQPAHGKDWNDSLMALQKAERMGTRKKTMERS